ncbi:MAG TPA: SpoIIE family protein phosphatase [Acetobacteraceae bacterium]
MTATGGSGASAGSDRRSARNESRGGNGGGGCHHPSFIVSPGAPEPVPCWLRSPAIGMLPKGKWALGTMEIPPGSRMYVFSDGAFEIIPANGQQWLIEDLRRIIEAPRVPGLSEAQRIYQAVRAAARPGPLDDDFSELVVRFE